VSLFVSSPVSNQKFEDYFSKLYHERWPKIRQALTEKERQVLRLNKYSKEVDVGGLQPCDFLENCYWRPEGYSLQKNKEGLYDFYVLDPASVFVARALQAEDGERILDMCAAPGGKSLILAEALKENGELICNELSASRRERLTKVIQQYIPREIRNRVWVTGKDGGKFALTHREKFDRILVDAPCSGERHLLRTPSELIAWKKSRSEKLAQRQYALMTAALIACRSGGRIVYATCSISPLENDGVIERLMKKKEGQFKVLPATDGEPTAFGTQFLPDRGGTGPIYFSALEKI
jgi:16S rRNA C967 or C1407 C5-methylase (RsmB/RsmF family)